jgi:hypothetical protein
LEAAVSVKSEREMEMERQGGSDIVLVVFSILGRKLL